MSDKGLRSGTCKELSNLNREKANYSMRKWAKDLSRDFTKENVRKANKHTRGSSSLAIKEIPIKATRHRTCENS